MFFTALALYGVYALDEPETRAAAELALTGMKSQPASNKSMDIDGSPALRGNVSMNASASSQTASVTSIDASYGFSRIPQGLLSGEFETPAASKKQDRRLVRRTRNIDGSPVLQVNASMSANASSHTASVTSVDASYGFSGTPQGLVSGDFEIPVLRGQARHTHTHTQRMRWLD